MHDTRTSSFLTFSPPESSSVFGIDDCVFMAVRGPLRGLRQGNKTQPFDPRSQELEGMRAMSLHPSRKVSSSSRRACRHFVLSSCFTYRQLNLYSTFITVFSPDDSCSRSVTSLLNSHDPTPTIQQDEYVIEAVREGSIGCET